MSISNATEMVPLQVVAWQSEQVRTFGERLSLAMDEAKLDGKGLSDASGVDTGHISRLRKRTDATRSIDTLERLASALDVRVEWLRSGAGEMRGGTRTVSSDASQEVREALNRFEWPSGTATAVVAEISDALAAEAFAHRGSYIPPSHWTGRINEELAARKGKRIAHVVTDDPVEERKRARKATRS